MAYGGFKDLARRTALEKILRDKAFNNAKNPKYDGYQSGLASMVYVLIKKSQVVVLIKKLNKINNWGLDLADMELMSKLNKGIIFLLCVIDIYRKNAWVNKT